MGTWRYWVLQWQAGPDGQAAWATPPVPWVRCVPSTPEAPALAVAADPGAVPLEGGVHCVGLHAVPECTWAHGTDGSTLSSCDNWPCTALVQSRKTLQLVRPDEPDRNTHFQGRRCTNATWPPGKSRTGRGCRRSVALRSSVVCGSAGSASSFHSLPCDAHQG